MPSWHTLARTRPHTPTRTPPAPTQSPQGRVTILRGKVEEVELPVDKVDIIISEWMVRGRGPPFFSCSSACSPLDEVDILISRVDAAMRGAPLNLVCLEGHVPVYPSIPPVALPP